jgi:LemA protein
MPVLLVFAGLLVFVLIYGVSIYNSLIASRNRFKNAFSQIHV